MELNNSYCNVLVVNVQSMTEENATCITMRSLFSNLPRENICEVSVSQTPIETERLKAVTLNNSFFPLRKILMSGAANSINKKIKASSSPDLASHKDALYKEKVRQLCYALSDMTPIIKRGEIVRKIGNFKPDVIYTIGCSILSLKLSYMLSKHYGVNIVMHFMDNWVEELEWSSNSLLKPYHRILKGYVKKCYKRSKCALAISEDMAKHYTELTGIRHEFIMNSVPVDDFRNEPREITSTVNVTYAGGLHLDRWVTLKEVEKQLLQYSERSQKSIVFNIYTSQADKEKYSDYFDNRITVFHNYVPHSEISRIYKASDILIHAETLNSKYNAFFKYSVSTKIPEYLSSGRPVILLCPKSMALYNYLKSNNAAYVADSTDSFLKLFESLINDKTERLNIINSAQKLAAENHDFYAVQKKFKHILEECKC